jgi:hypothetical protein
MAIDPSAKKSPTNSGLQRGANHRQKQSPGGKPKSLGNVRPWQLILGGIALTGGSMIIGAKISELILTFWMPGLLR